MWVRLRNKEVLLMIFSPEPYPKNCVTNSANILKWAHIPFNLSTSNYMGTILSEDITTHFTSIERTLLFEYGSMYNNVLGKERKCTIFL